MNLIVHGSKLSGHITVPGSKSHTIRALILASLADGKSIIRNPLASKDCIGCAKALTLLGAKISGIPEEKEWQVESSREQLKLPFFDKNNPLANAIDVGNSGTTMYFLSPVCATLSKNETVAFTGDESICRRPVGFLLDALNQRGCNAETLYENQISSAASSEKILHPPFLISGTLKAGRIATDGQLSQYVSGLMMACSQIEGKTEITLANPKEIPYLEMTKWWLESVGVKTLISDDYRRITLSGPQKINPFEKTIPSDWESVVFPLIAALISRSKIYIDGIDTSGTQGDEKIVEILKSVGAKIDFVPQEKSLFVDGTESFLTTKNLPQKKLCVNLESIPDAVCALAVIACFIEGTTELTGIEICRQKETDRIKVMKSELRKLGADITDCGNSLVIHGFAFGKNLFESKSAGSISVKSYGDHRVAMSLSCLGLGLKDGLSLKIEGSECCSVSFPGYVEKMNSIGACFAEC